MPRVRCRKLWTACGMGFVLLVAFLSIMHDPPQTHRILGIKVGHFFAYAWLMFWFAQIFKGAWSRILIGVALWAFGVGMEFLQDLTDYRTFSYFDMRDNGFGIVAGLMLALTPLRGALAAFEDLWFYREACRKDRHS